MKFKAFALVPFLFCLPIQSESSWFLSPQESKKIIISNQTVIIDARDKSKYNKSHIYNAHSLTWEELSLPDLPAKGNLLPTPQLVSIFEEYGISNETKVLIYGDPLDGWGEEGRIAWTLRSLGHKNTFIVDGGFPILIKQGIKTTQEIPPKPKRGKFINTPSKIYTADINKVKKSLNSHDVVFLDTREEREYIGGVPYGEARGGHLPGAKHLHYRDLMNQKGQILPHSQIKVLLRKKGIDENSKIINYCTGGIRSGWVTAVLNSAGFNAENYPGSMWEWSHKPEQDYPLVRGIN
ncbi:MAG: sulfurtransferase [Leptospira sp.]|nr:sulfurtransferase [Leptospira sp.]